MGEKIGIRPCVILIEAGKVLCVECKYGDEEFLLFPGGGVEPGETLKETAIREMEEETGLKVHIKKLVYFDDWIKDKKNNERVLNLFFLAERISGQILFGRKDEGKVKEVVWKDLKDFYKMNFRPKAIAERIYTDYLNNFSETVYLTQ
jgi:ADP-ribose pyrophosphatase YjhB (NUDIX family)